MKKKYIYNNITYDSKEEVEFAQWCDEAQRLGVINNYTYHCVEYLLSEKNDFFRKHIYTPDFSIEINDKYKNLFPMQTMVIDVKGAFAKHDGERSFRINQKWVYDKYKVYIHKVIPKEWFEKYGVPELCRFTEKTKKERECYKNFNTIEKLFLKNVNNNI